MAQLNFKHTQLTLTQLADEYGVSKVTLIRWLKPIHKELLTLSKVNKQRLRTLNPEQITKIKEFLS